MAFGEGGSATGQRELMRFTLGAMRGLAKNKASEFYNDISRALCRGARYHWLAPGGDVAVCAVDAVVGDVTAFSRE